MRLRMLNYCIWITIHYISWDVFISSVGVRSWQWYLYLLPCQTEELGVDGPEMLAFWWLSYHVACKHIGKWRALHLQRQQTSLSVLFLKEIRYFPWTTTGTIAQSRTNNNNNNNKIQQKIKVKEKHNCWGEGNATTKRLSEPKLESALPFLDEKAFHNKSGRRLIHFLFFVYLYQLNLDWKLSVSVEPGTAQYYHFIG